MSYSSMRQKVDSVIINGLSTNYPGMALMIPGVRFTKSPDTYVAFWYLEGDGMQAEIGYTSINRHIGILQLDVVTLENLGFGELDEIAQYLASLFNKKTFSLTDSAILRFRVPSFKDIPATEGRNRKMVSIAYWRDEPKS